MYAKTIRYSFLFVSVAISFLVAGCGERTSTLTGKVRFQGKNLTSGSVILYCEGQEIVRSAISQDGTYILTEAPRGKAIVTVQVHQRVPAGMAMNQNLPKMTSDSPRPPSAGAYSEARQVQIPSRYAIAAESGLNVVIDQSNQVFDIDLLP